MVNDKGRPKRKQTEWGHTSFYISESFIKTFEQFKKLAFIDKEKSEEFKEYAQTIEGEDIDLKVQGIQGLYMRWVLTNHVVNNLHKLDL